MKKLGRKLERNISKCRIAVNKGFLDVLLRVFCCEFIQISGVGWILTTHKGKCILSIYKTNIISDILLKCKERLYYAKA